MHRLPQHLVPNSLLSLSRSLFLLIIFIVVVELFIFPTKFLSLFHFAAILTCHFLPFFLSIVSTFKQLSPELEFFPPRVYQSPFWPHTKQQVLKSVILRHIIVKQVLSSALLHYFHPSNNSFMHACIVIACFTWTTKMKMKLGEKKRKMHKIQYCSSSFFSPFPFVLLVSSYYFL